MDTKEELERDRNLLEEVLEHANRLDEIANKESSGKIQIQRIAQGLRDMVRRQMSAIEAIKEELEKCDA